MSSFSPAWLALREGADARARDASLLEPLRALRRPGRTLRCIDLGSGSGANLRYLAPRLGRDQSWLLLDHDPTLLGHTRQALAAWSRLHGHVLTAMGEGLHLEGADFSVSLRWQCCDLANQFGSLGLAGIDLISASALLDLVSREWIDRLVRRCSRHRCALLIALSYDGQTAWRPTLPADAMVNVLLNRHQARDKGFGVAAGPRAASYLRGDLQAAGYRVLQGPSDWRLGAGDGQLQAALAQGWAQAALEIEPTQRAQIDAWLARRLSHIEGGGSSLRVGHVDLLGLPAEKGTVRFTAP
jgi:hypothetical protein